jgi:hypothetical protein
VLTLSGEAQAGQTIELWMRPGGLPASYGDEARRWKENGDFVVIRDWQVSAAALAILEARRLGVKICYGPTRANADPMLYLHQTRMRAGSRWVYHDEAGERFGLASPIHGYRKVHPREVGIRACPSNIEADTKVSPAPNFWSLSPKTYRAKTLW